MATPQIPIRDSIRQRRNILELLDEYKNGNLKPLSDLLRAWQGIQGLDPTLDNSFFVIAGYHGEPFRGAGWGNPQWWGGYCNHGNVLFPTWHRAYLLRLENALRSIEGCEDVTLPYWEETDDATKQNGLPWIFLKKTVQLDDGSTINNPLYSYKFGASVSDNLQEPPIVSASGDNVSIPNPDYSKPKGYETVRYPYSGLVGPSDEAATEAHNEQINALGEQKVDDMLNQNVQNWLDQSITLDNGQVIQTGVRQKYAQCLLAPNYTVFSNTTSAQQWNEDLFQGNTTGSSVVPLESPHNDIHLAIGGFEINGLGDFNAQSGANGDMGENDTASFDPIFYFHHCFIDKTFWKWQQGHDSTSELNIIQGYPGTNSVDSQGPTPGIAGGTWLDLDTPLAPFMTDKRQTTSKVMTLNTI
jgi:tyrosinase